MSEYKVQSELHSASDHCWGLEPDILTIEVKTKVFQRAVYSFSWSCSQDECMAVIIVTKNLYPHRTRFNCLFCHFLSVLSMVIYLEFLVSTFIHIGQIVMIVVASTWSFMMWLDLHKGNEIYLSQYYLVSVMVWMRMAPVLFRVSLMWTDTMTKVT